MDPQSLGMLGGMGGAPEPPAAGPDGGGPGDMSPEEILQAMLQLAMLYRQVETDHGDVLKIEKATTMLQQILADHQQQHDQLMGGNFSTMRRLAGG